MRREDYISDAEVVKRANAAVICDGKSKKLYYDDCDFWTLSEIKDITGVGDMEMKNLN